MSELFEILCAETRKCGSDFVVEILNRILQQAAVTNVSDVHFQPEKEGVEIRFRQNGVLQVFGRLEPEYATQIAARLKVLAHLLTYKTDTPQEGRVRGGVIPQITKEMRISTVATLYGERVVVRFFAEKNTFHYPNELGFPPEILEGLLRNLAKNGGAILITGPSGSGKTTTAYALLRELVERSEMVRSVITLEDPVEHALEHIAQIEVSERNPLSLDEMIKYMLRQDPEVLFVGEIRDKKTAEASLQAALTGHLLITTFHAGSAVEAVGRLCEIGIEPFVLQSSISQVLCQRLLRRLCPDCAEIKSESLTVSFAGEKHELSRYALPKGCPKCNGTGYVSRILIAETLPLDHGEIMRAILDRRDTHSIREIAIRHGMVPMSVQAIALLESQVTSPAEVQRVLG